MLKQIKFVLRWNIVILRENLFPNTANYAISRESWTCVSTHHCKIDPLISLNTENTEDWNWNSLFTLKLNLEIHFKTHTALSENWETQKLYAWQYSKDLVLQNLNSSKGKYKKPSCFESKLDLDGML